MDRRSEQRQQLDTRAWAGAMYRVLGSYTPDETFEAVPVDISGIGLRLDCDRELAPDAAVRIDVAEQTWLGEVRYCQPVAGGRYMVGIRLRESLEWTVGLKRLLQELTEPPTPQALRK